MTSKVMPRYPVFIPSKGRAGSLLTPKAFAADGVPFHLVVEPQEVAAYVKVWGAERVLSLPENDKGLVYSRNWIKDYSISKGHVRHWQFDDDVRRMIRVHQGERKYCAANVALAAAEDFVDRYENVALASFNSEFFVPVTYGTTRCDWPPFYLNSRCYTCFLMLNALPNRWRGRYNEDTDMSLQVLASGWCTILFNAFCIMTPATLTRGGGQMVSAYGGDGRLAMSRELESRWPGVVETRRKFGRPQHSVKGLWKKFTTPLRRKEGLVIPEKNEYGLELKKVK